MFWYGHDMSGWGYGLMIFGSIVFWALLIAAIVLLVRYFTRSGQQPGGAPPSGGQPPPPARGAEQVLAERFARGEIDEDEYRHRLATLRSAGSQQAHRS